MPRRLGLSSVLSLSLCFLLHHCLPAETIRLPGDVPLEMLPVPAGTFWMGAYVDEQDACKDETPQHRVTLSHGFWMGRCEVTSGPVVRGDGHQAPGRVGPWSRNARITPAVYISWDDAQAFVARLNQLHLAGPRQFRLPTEAEWEYACRAGTRTRFFLGRRSGLSRDRPARLVAGNRAG